MAMSGPNAARDVRLSGFGNRAALSTALAWLDARSVSFRQEIVPLVEAVGRVLAEPITTGTDPSGPPRAAENGYAVHAADCDGASTYNPLLLSLVEPGAAELASGFACPVTSGLPLPSGANAVLSFEAAQPAGPRTLEVLAPVAPGTGVDRAVPAGVEHGRRIGPPEVGAIAAMGIERVTVLRRPRVALVVMGSKSGPDVLTPMLRTLLARDGAEAAPIAITGSGEDALVKALTGDDIDTCALVLIAGRAGTGADDVAPPALEAAGGTLIHHGFALHPGGASGLGVLRGSETIPVVLLPGEPLGCLVAYDLLASRLVRRQAGAKRMFPYHAAEFELARKIASGLGIVEIVPVRLDSGRATPIGIDGGLAGAIQADGFVMVPEGSEGYLAGSRVRVHLYHSTRTDTAREIGS